jgi:hypothetical protein
MCYDNTINKERGSGNPQSYRTELWYLKHSKFFSWAVGVIPTPASMKVQQVMASAQDRQNSCTILNLTEL